eukprot:gene1367-32731_t
MEEVADINCILPAQADAIAGISVGFMVVPQGMSYANSAGLPSVYGLYGAFLPCIAYTLVGSSKQLAVGPCQDKYNKAAIQLAFIVAMLYTILGVLRLGWVTKFLSHAVISGFTTGAAVKCLLGFSIDMVAHYEKRESELPSETLLVTRVAPSGT